MEKMYWERYSQKKINQLINEALNKNYNYKEEAILGIPGTYLDELEFYDDAPFLEHAPFLRTMIANLIILVVIPWKKKLLEYLLELKPLRKR